MSAAPFSSILLVVTNPAVFQRFGLICSVSDVLLNGADSAQGAAP